MEKYETQVREWREEAIILYRRVLGKMIKDFGFPRMEFSGKEFDTLDSYIERKKKLKTIWSTFEPERTKENCLYG